MGTDLVSVGGFFEKTSLENDEDGDTDRNGRIGDVEDGPEEDELIPSPEREPVRVEALDDREIEHVHHLAVQEAAVAPLGGHEPGNLVKGAFAEDHPVKGAVDDVAQGTGQDQGYAEHEPRRLVTADHADQVPSDGDHREDPENAQGDLAKLATEFHSEGHPFIFSEMENEPIAEDRDLASGADEHAGLDPDLECLIGDQDKHDNEDGTLQLRSNWEISRLNYFFCG